MGAMMSVAAFAAAFIGPGWSGIAVALLAALFGLSAFCWAGIGIAEAVRQVAPTMVPEASSGIIAITFFGALAGPTMYSTVAALAGTAVPAFLILSALSATGSALLLWPRR
jgi:hypothetical protein